MQPRDGTCLGKLESFRYSSSQGHGTCWRVHVHAAILARLSGREAVLRGQRHSPPMSIRAPRGKYYCANRSARASPISQAFQRLCIHDEVSPVPRKRRHGLVKLTACRHLSSKTVASALVEGVESVPRLTYLATRMCKRNRCSVLAPI